MDVGNLKGAAKWHTHKGVQVSKVVLKASPEQVAQIKALYYFNGEMKYCETFTRLEELNRERMSQSDWLADSVDHLLKKTSFLQYVLNSLNFLGQDSRVDSMLARYGLLERKSVSLEESDKLIGVKRLAVI